jgi:hypothetical protein
MLLAAAWPESSDLERVVLEVDVDGGVAGARYGVGVEPGAQVFVTDLRHVGDASVPLQTAGRLLGEGAWLVPGPESAEAARRLWSADRAAPTVASSLGRDPKRVWLCDVGRITPASATAPFLAASSLMLLFCRDQPADLVQVPSRVAALRQVAGEVGVVVVGAPPYERGELSTFFGCRQVWIVPAADDLVEISRQVWTNKRVRRSPLWRAAVGLAADVSVPTLYRSERGAL